MFYEEHVKDKWAAPVTEALMNEVKQIGLFNRTHKRYGEDFSWSRSPDQMRLMFQELTKRVEKNENITI